MSVKRNIVSRIIIALAALLLVTWLIPAAATAGCAKGEEKKLHQAYKKWCDKSGTRSCTKKIKKGDCAEYKRRADINKECYEGRKEMTDTCYDGKFDKGHKKAYDDAVKAEKKCLDLYKKYKCK